MTDNPYGKLTEALRVYVNPTLELITSGVDLSEHCYYHINKLPSSKSDFWSHLEKHDFDDILDYLTEDVSKVKVAKVTKVAKNKLIDEERLISNLQMAQKKNDQSYLEYLSSQRPKSKLMVSLIRRKTIIPENVAKDLKISDDELNTLTTIKLKMSMHKYIADHELQQDRKVMIDDVLKSLLDCQENDIPIDYFKLLKIFNKKYVQRFSDEDSESTATSI